MKRFSRNDFVDGLSNMIEDNVSLTVLIRGYFHEEKLSGVLAAIESIDKLKDGLFVVSSIGEVPRLFEKSFKRKFSKVKQNQTYNFANSKNRFIRRTNSSDKFGYDEDFIVFYPVESLLFKEKDTESFISQLKNSPVPIKIIITTNDYSERAEKLYPFVDEVVILDVNDLHAETYSTLENNLKRKGRVLPY